MTLEELEQLRNLNALDILYKILDIGDSAKIDAESSIKGVKDAGIRLRKKMQDIKLLSDVIRDKVQIQKSADWSDKRKFILDKAIKAEQEKINKEDKAIQKRKQKRLQELNN